MSQLRLSPDAFGTLLALKRIKKIKFYEPAVAKELISTGLAREEEQALIITDAGKAARRQAKSIQRHLLSRKSTSGKQKVREA